MQRRKSQEGNTESQMGKRQIAPCFSLILLYHSLCIVDVYTAVWIMDVQEIRRGRRKKFEYKVNLFHHSFHSVDSVVAINFVPKITKQCILEILDSRFHSSRISAQGHWRSFLLKNDP